MDGHFMLNIIGLLFLIVSLIGPIWYTWLNKWYLIPYFGFIGLMSYTLSKPEYFEEYSDPFWRGCDSWAWLKSMPPICSFLYDVITVSFVLSVMFYYAGTMWKFDRLHRR